MSTPAVHLSITNPQVTELHAVQASVEEEHLNWTVGYAPTDLPISNARVVFGTIHAGNSDGFAEATVAVLMTYAEAEEPGDAFVDVLLESSALETLWDITRVAFNSLTGTAGIRIDVPSQSPEPEVHVLARTADDDENEEGSPALDEG